jgi:hypothetical protein
MDLGERGYDGDMLTEFIWFGIVTRDGLVRIQQRTFKAHKTISALYHIPYILLLIKSN